MDTSSHIVIRVCVLFPFFFFFLFLLAVAFDRNVRFSSSKFSMEVDPVSSILNESKDGKLHYICTENNWFLDFLPFHFLFLYGNLLLFIFLFLPLVPVFPLRIIRLGQFDKI